MPVPLKQFLTPVLLRIFPIQNLEPRTLLSLCDVGSRFLLGNDTLQIQFGLAEIMPSRDHVRISVSRLYTNDQGSERNGLFSTATAAARI